MGGYKEHNIFNMLKRKSIIIRYIFFIALIFIITSVLVVYITKSKENKSIAYVENSEVNYKVYLKDNDFFNKSYLEKDKQYISSLIKYIEANFKYELEACNQEENIDYKYTYKVVAETRVEDKTNHNSLYDFSEDLIEEKEYSANTNQKVKIIEHIKIDYNRYNNLIKKFVDIYDLEGNVSTLTVSMYVNIKDDINQENSKNNIPVVSLSVPLTTKTMAIDIESNEVNENNISVCKKTETEKYIFGAVILIAIDILLIVKLAIFIKDTKDEKAIYKMRLRKIMSNYGSYIQKLNNDFEFEGYQVLEIKSFEDLLQVRETINKPILMTEKISAMETFFFIPSEKNVYIYELKAGNLRKNKGKRFKEKEEVNI